MGLGTFNYVGLLSHLDGERHSNPQHPANGNRNRKRVPPQLQPQLRTAALLRPHGSRLQSTSQPPHEPQLRSRNSTPERAAHGNGPAPERAATAVRGQTWASRGVNFTWPSRTSSLSVRGASFRWHQTSHCHNLNQCCAQPTRPWTWRTTLYATGFLDGREDPANKIAW